MADEQEILPSYRLPKDNSTIGELRLEIRFLRRDIESLVKVVDALKLDLKEQDNDNADEYVTQTEFYPIKTIAYGMVAAILLAVLTGLLAIVVTGKK